MRILLTADPELPVPPRLYGGIERVIDLLIKGLRGRGHQVGLMAHRDSTSEVDAFFAWPGLRSQHRGDMARNTAALWKAARSFRPDVLHSFSRVAYLMPLMMSSLPKVMSFQRGPGLKTGRWGSRLSGGTLCFTGCSEHICRQGRTGGGRWVAIPNAVELHVYPFVEQVAPDAPLAFLSRIERIKGTAESMDAAHAAGRRLVIAGNKPDDAQAQRYWTEEIEPRLARMDAEYIGPVDDAGKAKLLGSAAAMLVPVQWEEPFGIVFAEALACGTPVISTRRGSLPEIVEHGKHGFLADDMAGWVDGIRRIGTIRRADCRARVEQCYSAEVVVGSYERLYKELSRG